MKHSNVNSCSNIMGMCDLCVCVCMQLHIMCILLLLTFISTRYPPSTIGCFPGWPCTTFYHRRSNKHISVYPYTIALLGPWTSHYLCNVLCPHRHALFAQQPVIHLQLYMYTLIYQLQYNIHVSTYNTELHGCTLYVKNVDLYATLFNLISLLIYNCIIYFIHSLHSRKKFFNFYEFFIFIFLTSQVSGLIN